MKLRWLLINLNVNVLLGTIDGAAFGAPADPFRVHNEIVPEIGIGVDVWTLLDWKRWKTAMMRQTQIDLRRRDSARRHRPQRAPGVGLVGIWQGGRSSPGSTAATCSSCTSKYRQDPSSVDAETRAFFERWTPPAEDATAAVPEGLALREDRRRRQPGPVDPAVRAPGGPARSARQPADRAIRRCCPKPTASRRPSCDGLPASLVSSPLVRGAPRTCSRSSRRSAASTARRPATTSSHVFVPEERRLAAPGGRVRPLPRAGRSDRSGRAARSADAGRGVRALPPAHVSRQDALLDRGARHARADPRRGDWRRGRSRHAQHPHRHGAPRAPQRHGARAREAVRADARRVQGSGLVAHVPRGHGVDRRREVPRRRAPRDQGRTPDGRGRLDAAEPEPSRGGRSRRRRHGAGGRDDGRTSPARRVSIRTRACRS